MTLRTLARPRTVPAEPAVKPPSGLVSDREHGHYDISRERLLYHNRKRSTWRHTALAWLRDHVNSAIPRAYYNLVLGHNLHASVWAELHVRHFHYGQPDPFTGQLEFHDVLRNGVVESVSGWWENIGRVSKGKVTDAFVSFEIAQLVAEDSEYGDFKFHRVGTDDTAENNDHTALLADSGITGATGDQTDADPDYETVATVTADATETWEEHGIFSQAGTATPAGTLMDRSKIVPNVSVVADDTVEFTYTLTKNPEA